MITKTVFSYYSACITFSGVRVTTHHYKMQFEFSFVVSKQEFKAYDPIFSKYVSVPGIAIMASQNPKTGKVHVAGRVDHVSEMLVELAQAMKKQNNPNWELLKVEIS